MWAGRGESVRQTHEPGYYRSAAYSPLRPWQVRGRQFRSTRRWRRGLDPEEVREFLDQVADDLASVYDALGVSRQEADRIKDALRCWQSEQAERAHAGQR
ncbi:DivIVA domain-containing protein [Micromonospora sp. NBC_01739]|uniref:DivIVA domain-containing protein n=1 Tax=Micromonospora sp. NBC_01739 TaxID=2975985 RepID=UPI002E1051D0|nr:DivIVA domain-containing protein [Micromonospora sp. NBC_01739]